MDFSLTDEQVVIEEMARTFALERLAPGAAEWDASCSLPIDVLKEAAGLGMGLIYAPEADGGSGLSRLDGALIFEALSRGCPTVAAFISIHNLAATLIVRWCSDEQRRRWLPDLASMDRFASYCLTEPGCGSDAAALRTRAERDGDDYVLNGTKQFISGAGLSGVYVTMARTGGEGASGVSAIVVEKDTPGLSFGKPERKMGWNAQPTATVVFEDVRVPATNRLGDEGMGFKYALAGLDNGRVNIASCSLGAAAVALEQSLGYLKERRAFGRELAEFQGLQFKAADMATELDAARLMVYRAARALDEGDPHATRYCAMAKRFATDVCSAIVNEAMQIHGGYGYLADYGVEKLVRDLRVHQILEGTNEIMRLIIARDLLRLTN